MRFPIIPQGIQRFITPSVVLIIGGILALLLHAHRNSVFAEGDLGCFMAIAQQMTQGAWLYDGVWDNKAPGVFLLHAAAQLCTRNPNYPLWITQILILLMASSAAYRFRSAPTYKAVIIGIGVAYFILKGFLFWEMSFIGGFTEEWGMILLATAWFLFDASKSPGILMLSGLAFGAAIFIKEPFALFYPIFLASGCYRSIWLPKKIAVWHGATVLPWLLFALIYLLTGRFHYLVSYLQGAFLYSGEAGSGLSSFKPRWEHISQFFNPWILEMESWRRLIIFLMATRVLWLLYLRYRFAKIYDIGSWYLAWGLALLAGMVFMSLGAHGYLHYAIPFTAVYTFGFVLFWVDGIQSLSRYSGNVFAPWLFLGSALLFRYQNEIHAPSNQALNQNLQSVEIREIWNKIPQKSRVYVDHEHFGRFYFYLNAKRVSRYPVPYYTYFYNPTDNQRPDLIAHRVRFKTDFPQNPPEFILTTQRNKWGSVFDFTQLTPWLDAHYSLSDSISNAKYTVYIKKYHP